MAIRDRSNWLIMFNFKIWT